jgi:Zn-dependent M28 family amino/carboxypeptidase
MAPLRDLGVTTVSQQKTGSTDHARFDEADIPGFQFIQDPLDYFSQTHHTNLDTYERIIEADAKASATVIAATVYRLAMSDEMLPRFTKDDMPPVGQR